MEILFKNSNDWRNWLEVNSKKEKEIWLIYYKKHVYKKSISYEEAVRVALCFGWVDSLVKRIDDEKYMQKYTPRKPKSNWSESNKKRIEVLTKDGLIRAPGLASIEQAKKNGSWYNLTGVDENTTVPQLLLDALSKDSQAENNFNNFPMSSRKQYIGWLKSAKRQETKEKRIREIIRRSRANIKAGII